MLLLLLHLVGIATASLDDSLNANLLKGSDAVVWQDNEGLTFVLAYGTLLAGQVLNTTAAVSSVDVCAAACREDNSCSWFAWCSNAVRLDAGGRPTPGAHGRPGFPHSHPPCRHCAGWVHHT